MILPLLAAGGALASLFGGESEEDKKKKIEKESQAARDKMSADQAQFAKQYEAGREADLAKGRGRGQELFGEGKLGRVNEQRSGDIADVVARRKEFLQGYTPEEMQAMRDQNMKSLQRNQAGQARQLQAQQAASGVRGATSAAQQMALQKSGMEQARGMEQDLFQKNADLKRQALGQFETSVTGAEANELARQQYNQGQKNKELQAQLATEFGYAQLGSADRAAAAQQASAMYQADAQRKAAAEQGKKK